MELNRIEYLLERYFEGETTLVEEKAIKAYFEQGEVAPHLEEYRPMFIAFAEAKQEKFNRPLVLPQENSFKKWMPIAASIALILGLVFVGQNALTANRDYGTYDNPEVAAQKAKQTLYAISGMMSEGTQKLHVLNTFEEQSNKFLK